MTIQRFTKFKHTESKFFMNRMVPLKNSEYKPFHVNANIKHSHSTSPLVRSHHRLSSSRPLVHPPTSGKTQIPNPSRLPIFRQDDWEKARKNEITSITLIRVTEIGSYLLEGFFLFSKVITSIYLSFSADYSCTLKDNQYLKWYRQGFETFS